MPFARLSVIIPNFNYERFVGAAIDSALALDWPDVEVVVVDDGSTDNSLEVIRSYGDRIRVLAIENSTQRVAVNRGFAATTGDVIVVLDADDVLPPELPSRLAQVWGPAVSKVQFRMQRIDESGMPIGTPFPAFDPPPTPAQVRLWATATTAYPTPPGSANAYARWFLDRLMPVGAEVGAAADSAPLACAPFLGDVVTVPEVTVSYRRHAGNDSTLTADPERFPREVRRAQARWRAAGNICGGGLDERALFRSRELLQLRVAAVRMTPGPPPLPGDSRLRMAADAVTSARHPGPEGWSTRLIIAGWCLAVLVAPQRLAHQLIGARYGEARHA